LHDLCKGAQTKRIFYSLISEGCENENKKVNTNWFAVCLHHIPCENRLWNQYPHPITTDLLFSMGM